MAKHDHGNTVIAGGCSRFKRENMPPNFSVVCEVGLGYRGSGAAEGSVYSALSSCYWQNWHCVRQ
jgi:hypothetical protein